MSEVISTTPIQGPKISWNYDDVNKMVDKYGVDGAIDKLTGRYFNRDYVEQTVKDILIWGEGMPLHTSSSSFGDGTIT